MAFDDIAPDKRRVATSHSLGDALFRPERSDRITVTVFDGDGISGDCKRFTPSGAAISASDFDNVDRRWRRGKPRKPWHDGKESHADEHQAAGGQVG